MDIIEINNLRLRTQIGFSAHELGERQDIVISLRLGTNRLRAGETDKPEDAFNYKTVTKAIIRHVENARYFLIEKLAEEIAKLCIIEHHAPYVEVRVHKPGALRHSDSVGLRIERRPEDYQNTIVYVSLSTKFNSEEILIRAVKHLRSTTTVLALSPIYQISDSLTMTVKIHTYRTQLDFQTQVINHIESELALRLKLLLWNNDPVEYDSDDISITIPLAELAPDYQINGKTFIEIADSLDKSEMEVVNINFDK